MATEVYRSKANEGGEIPEALAERIMRGVELFRTHGQEIQWVGEDRCKVPSKSRKDYFHLVVFGDEGERCSCYDFGRHGKEIGACLHTIAALISWSKRVDYRVEKRHDSRDETYLWDVVETRAGEDRVVSTFSYVGSAYRAKWQLEGIEEAV